jgi:hypothetical protein
MNYLSKNISFAFDSVRRRVVKVFRNGRSDAKTAQEALPFGFDSGSLKDMIAVYLDTQTKGKGVIVGYLNLNQLAQVGESRMFSTDANGQLQIYMWLKNDGTMELGGNTKHLARFEELESGFNQLKSDFNQFLTHVHGGSGTPPAPPQTPSTASIASAKINEIKTL